MSLYGEKRVDRLTLENKMKTRVNIKTYINYYFMHNKKQNENEKKMTKTYGIYFCMQKQFRINYINIKIYDSGKVTGVQEDEKSFLLCKVHNNYVGK